MNLWILNSVRVLNSLLLKNWKIYVAEGCLRLWCLAPKASSRFYANLVKSLSKEREESITLLNSKILPSGLLLSPLRLDPKNGSSRVGFVFVLNLNGLRISQPEPNPFIKRIEKLWSEPNPFIKRVDPFNPFKIN